MISADLATWAVALEDADLRVAYVEALEWIYEDASGPFPIMWEALVSTRGDPFVSDTTMDELAGIIMLEIAGRWVYQRDGVTS